MVAIFYTGALILCHIFLKSYKKAKVEKANKKWVESLEVSYTTIGENIQNRDKTKCKKIYEGFLASFEEKPNISFVSFLFQSLEERKIPITQELIDSIRKMEKVIS